MAEELVAEVGPLSRGARLSLFGAQGYLEGFRVDDASESCCNRVAQCWMDVVERGAARIGAKSGWHYRQCGVRALAAQGKKAEAIRQRAPEAEFAPS